MQIYTPLDAAQNEIRLISIESCGIGPDGASSELIRCTMTTVSLDAWMPKYQEFTADIPKTRWLHSHMYDEWCCFVLDMPKSDLAVHDGDRKAGSPGDDANLRFRRFSWGDYETLSYTWDYGSPDTHLIELNGQPYQVGDNLFCALRRFRETGRYSSGTRLWVDAICINQDDTAEKSIQVRRMKDIYGIAARTVVWLGDSLHLGDVSDEEYFKGLDSILKRVSTVVYLDTDWDSEDSSESDWSTISSESYQHSTSGNDIPLGEHGEHLTRSRDSGSSGSRSVASSESTRSTCTADLEEKERLIEDERSLLRLIKLPPDVHPDPHLPECTSALPFLLFPLLHLKYWGRVWIIQELALSSDSAVLCVGKAELELTRLLDSIDHILKPLEARAALTMGPDTQSPFTNFMHTITLLAKIKRYWHRGPSLWTSRTLSSSWLTQGILSNASLAHDRVYGMMGLLEDSIAAEIKVDYSRTMQQMSIDLTFAIMRELSCFGQFNFRRARDGLLSGLPTWAIDLTHDYHYLRDLDYLGPEITTLRFDWSDFTTRQRSSLDQRVLLVRGSWLDTIDGLTAYVPDSGTVEIAAESAVPQLNWDAMANTLGSNHAYASDSDMLMELKGVLSWAAGASGSSDYVCVFDLPLLGSDPRDAAQPLTSADGFINGAIDLLARMRRFLDANANFRLWSLRLGTVFSGFRYISGTPPRRRVADSQARAHRLLQRTSSKYREELPSAIMDVVMFGGQRLMTTEKGRLGLAPMGARRGDHIYMIEGCGTVVVLRAIEGHHEEFEYVGLAYMPSFNDSTTVQRCRGGEFQTELKLV